MYYEDETTADALQAWSDDRLQADLEQAEMEAQGDRLYAHEQAGFCTHQSAVGYLTVPFYPEQEGLRPGEYRCTGGCGSLFRNETEWVDASRDPYASPVPARSVPPAAPTPEPACSRNRQEPPTSAVENRS
ncbi:hypothetical protein SMD44_p10009 (plasmid) [Streptomyces alboflavus]|uniref:Uncharacterized protein n=1 Tax=Streptomyces alboflavus TaxID=67267 RepID=A0A291W3B0_9ACTN|nr:hypothetical protein [Streptomyces alboflavus]ATM24508.1 hypothetical protein SMD44_p10009 [Streptomyces alboflavus]